MKLEVFYVTYRKDLSWICYSVQLMQKFFRSPFHTTICANRDCEDVLETWGLRDTTYFYVDPWPDGYAFAMYLKTMADQYCEADLIMVLDSDHLLLEPVYLDRFLFEGFPIIRWRPWDDDPNDAGLIEGRRQWAPPTERVMGIPLDRDYMLGPPFLFWHQDFAGVRNRIEEATGLPFYDAVYSDKPYDCRNFLSHPKVYCDYESLGLYAAKFAPERYIFSRYQKGAHWPFRVYWSHGDWSASLQVELDSLLKKPLLEPFNGDRFVAAEVQALIAKHAVRTVIETGTYRGTTTAALAGMVPWVITIDIKDEFSIDHLNKLGVTCLLGDSAEQLPVAIRGTPGPILYYLDAHWEKHSPLLEELRAIAEAQRPDAAVIVIHDFKNPVRPQYGYDTWDTGPYNYELIVDSLDRIYGGANYNFHYNREAEGDYRGVIYIEPK